MYVSSIVNSFIVLVTLFQKEASCETFHMKMSTFYTKTRFDTEAKGKWEMTYCDICGFFFQTLGTPTEDSWPGITSNEIFLSGKYFYCSIHVRSSAMWLICLFCCLFRKVSILPKGTSYKSLAKVQSMHCRTVFL